MVRFADDAEQLKARDVVKDEKTGSPRTTSTRCRSRRARRRWLRKIGLRPMPLGLDLRGGLYLLYQVDVDGAVEQLLDTLRRRTSAARSRPTKHPVHRRHTLTVDSETSRTACASLLPPGADRGKPCAPRSRRRMPDLACSRRHRRRRRRPSSAC